MHVTFLFIYLGNKCTNYHFINHFLLVFCLNEFYLYKLNEFSRVKRGQSFLIETMNKIFWGYSHYLWRMCGWCYPMLIRLSKTQWIHFLFHWKIIYFDWFFMNRLPYLIRFAYYLKIQLKKKSISPMVLQSSSFSWITL